MGQRENGPAVAGMPPREARNAADSAHEAAMEPPRGPVTARAEAGMESPDTGWETVPEVARIAGASVKLVRRYADLGLIASTRNRNGHRMFPAGTGARVRQLKAERVERAASARVTARSG